MSSMEPDEPGESGEHVSEDEAWAAIVAHYGDRPELEPSELGTTTELAPEQLDPRDAIDPVVTPVFDDDVDEEPDWEDELLLAGSFVAPDPGPLGWHGWRSAAWIGVLGAPVVALVWAILAEATSWQAPTWLGYLLGSVFLGSFVYLIATMPRERDDPLDDGARV